jgi:hypothetical protein
VAAADSLTVGKPLAYIRRFFIFSETLEEKGFRDWAGADGCVLYQLAILQSANDPFGVVKSERCSADHGDGQVKIKQLPQALGSAGRIRQSISQPLSDHE